MSAATLWLRNVGSGYANAVVGGLIFVFLTPLLLHKLGAAAYAVWVLAQTITFYLHFFDSGLHNAQVRYHARFAAHGRSRALRQLLSTTLISLAAAGLLAALCGALIALSPVSSWENLPAPLAADFRWALIVLSVNLLIDIPAQALENLYEGAQRFDLRNLRMLAFSLLTAAAQIGLLVFGYGIVALAGAELAATMASILVDVAIIRRCFPGLLNVSEGFSRRMWKRIRRYASWAFIDDLLVEGTAQLDKLLLAAFLPIVTLTPYALSLSLGGVLFAAVGPMTETFFPMATDLQAQQRREELMRLLVDGSKAVTAVAAPMAIYFCFLGEPLLRLWVPEGVADLPSGLVPLAVLNSLAGVYLWTFTVLLMAANRIRLVAVLTLIEVSIEIALVLLLVRGYGLIGLAVAGLTAHLLMGFCVKVPLVARAQQISLRAILVPSLGRLCLASVPAVWVALHMSKNGGEDWPSLIWAAIAIALAYLAGLLVLGLNRRERVQLVAIWQRFAARLAA